MHRETIDSSLEKKFLTAMITSKAFLATASQGIDTSLFHTTYLRQVADWCVEYFKAYEDAPGAALEAIFHSWVENEKPEETDVEAIEDFLSGLSQRHDESPNLNIPFLLDEMAKYLTLRKITVLKENLETCLLRGEKEAALTYITDFRVVDVNETSGFSPLTNKEAWSKAFADPPEPLISLPGAAGEFFDQATTRDSLIAIQAPEKRGKTFWCLEFVYRALRARKRVALFEVGDLSESQIMKRLGVRLARLPLWKSQLKDVPVPSKIKIERGENGELRYDLSGSKESFPHPLTRVDAWKACKKFLYRLSLPKDEPYLMFSIHPNSSINVAGVNQLLERWKLDSGFIPDVIIIDYADILAPEDSRKEPRHQVNETWKALRRLSQERHSLVIAPTQSNAAAYKADTQKMTHFSEDKRKLAHVTGMVALNQTDEEKRDGVMRLNWIVLRESEFHVNSCLWVAQCLPLAQALCCSAR